MRIGNTSSYRVQPVHPIVKTGSATQKPRDLPQRKEKPKEELREGGELPVPAENVGTLTSWWKATIGKVFTEAEPGDDREDRSPRIHFHA